MPSKPYIWQIELDVVGLGFRLKKDVRRALADRIAKRGSITGVRLEREPDNPADPNAIKVMLRNGQHIGFLRASSAMLLAERLDNGSLEVVRCALLAIHEKGEWKEGTLLVVFKDVPKRATEPKTSRLTK